MHSALDPGQPGEHDFGVALAHMWAGRFVTRRKWSGLVQLPRYLMILRDDTPRIIACWNGPPPRVGTWRPWANDLLAKDWRAVTASEAMG